MTFVYPLGLLGLIGIPILIIIYIIKNKYTEQTITSTYIWNLSEKFLKNKKPISKLKGLISLIMQCLAVLFISLILAHPIFIIPNAANDYCFILDASASMNKIQDNKTRFEIAKDKIKEEINSSLDGSKYSFIIVGNEVVEYNDYTTKSKAIEAIDNVECSYISNNCTNSLKYAQEHFDRNRSLKTYLYTDKSYNVENINLVNVGNNDVNYAIVDGNYQINSGYTNADGAYIMGTIDFKGNVISYSTEASLNLELYVDDELKDEMSINVKPSEQYEYVFRVELASFKKARIHIKNEDSLALDNDYELYNITEEQAYKALIVSENEFYLQSILKVYDKVQSIDVIKPIAYSNTYTGYNLYIFDSYSPDSLPTDGTIWFFNPQKSITGSRFSYRNSIDLNGDNTNTDLIGKELIQSTVYGEEKKLVEGLIKTDGKDENKYGLYVMNYNIYGINKNFTTLFTVDDNPVIFTGVSQYGNREVVFGFDLHYSNLPLSFNYIRLMSNLLDYSFPTVVEKSNYICGENALINVLPNTKSIRITSPSNSYRYIDTNSATSSFLLTEIGNYNITITLENNNVMELNIYSSYPLEENVDTTQDTLRLVGQQENNNSDGRYDNLLILFILLGLLFVVDWMVYCYEQHQLF